MERNGMEYKFSILRNTAKTLNFTHVNFNKCFYKSNLEVGKLYTLRAGLKS